MSESVPEGWEVESLSSVSKKIWIGLVTSMTKHYVDKGVPLIRNSDITQRGIDSSKLINLDPNFSDGNVSRVILTNDVVTVHTGDIGTSAVIKENLSGAHGFATLNSRIDNKKINSYYYCFFLNSEHFKKQAKKVITGDGRDNLNLNDFIKLLITFPPLPEQKKIASILTTVDEVIEKTQSQINKLQDLKKATMNELLTKGIGHTEFKDSALGRIPKSWEVVSIEELGEVIGGGTPATERLEFWNGSVLWATPSEITKLKGRYINKTIRTISEEGIQSSSAKLHPPGTILLTSRASIGYPAINLVPMATNQGFQSLRPNEKLECEYGYLLFLKSRYKLEQLSAGSTFLEISSKEIKKLKVSIPSLNEQNKIALIIISIEKNIEKSQQKLHQTQSLKKSLMQDLLTGKVRVTVN